MGLRLEPQLTLRILASKLWAVLVCLLLLHLLIWYHIVAATSILGTYISPTLAHNLAGAFSRVFWKIAAFFQHANDVHVSVTGDRIVALSALVVCNHQSLADYFLLEQLAKSSTGHVRPRVNFFTWYAVWQIPTVKTWLNMVLCDENWELSKLLCESAFLKILASEAPQWVVVFPEVNIWTPTAAYQQRMQAKKYYLPYYDHTLYPRYPGLSNAVCTLGTKTNIKFSHAYNVTIFYHTKRPPTLLQVFGSPTKICVTIDVKALPFNSIPQRKAKLEKWLERTWLEKDKQLAAMKRNDGLRKPDKPTHNFLLDTPLASVFPLTRPASHG